MAKKPNEIAAVVIFVSGEGSRIFELSGDVIMDEQEGYPGICVRRHTIFNSP